MADINKLVPDSVFHENIDIEKQKFAQKQDKMQVTILPDPTLETSLDKVFIYVGETSAVTGLTKGQSYISNGTAWVETATKVEPATSSTAGIVKPDNTSITVDSNGTISTPALLQMTVLPTASADYLGKIVQLTQAQTGYTKGFIYECVSDGNAPPAYLWTETNIQGSIDISSQTGNLIETKADGIYVGETTVIDNVDTLPVGSNIEDVFYRVTFTGKLYKGDSTNQTTTLVTPDFDSNDFDVDNNTVALSAAQRIFTGTQAEWEALTTEEKANYTVVNFPDDDSPEEFDTRLSAVEDVIPSGASESNQLVTENNIVHKISFNTDAGMTGYYTQTGTLVHVHIDAYKETNWTDWQSLATVGAIPAPATAVTNILTKGSKSTLTGDPVGLYIFATGSINEAGSGGMVAGSYVWDFIYDIDTGEVVKNNGLIDITTSDLTSTVTSGSTAPITSGGVYSALAPLRYAEVSTESQMRALYTGAGGMQLVHLSAAITVNDVTIPVGTEGIFFASTSDRHFIGQYYDSAIYSWFMNSNGANTIRKFSTSN